MANFLSSSLTFTHYHVNDLPSGADIPALLKQFAFISIDNVAEERAYGWANFDDYLDTEWHVSPPEKGEYMAFALRFDRRNIPPAIFKKELTLAMQKEQESLAQNGQKFISKDRKKEIRETVRLRLLGETKPTPSYFPVVWNMTTNDLFFFSAAKGPRGMFEDYFLRTFNAHVTPHDDVIFERLADIMDDNGECPHYADFLKWLWFCAEQERSFGEVWVYMGGKIQLADINTRCAIDSTDGGLDEALFALRLGNEIKSASFIFSDKVQGVTAILSADNPGIIRGLKTPKIAMPEAGDDPDAAFLEKVYLLDKAIEYLNVMFEQFVALRPEPALWAIEVESMMKWLDGKEKE